MVTAQAMRLRFWRPAPIVPPALKALDQLDQATEVLSKVVARLRDIDLTRDAPPPQLTPKPLSL